MSDAIHVLFLCPHAAAKSVLAMTYFAAMAAEVGLEVTVSNAGTEPDQEINPAVYRYLLEEGFDLTGFKPTHLMAHHLDAADLIVSLGCLYPEQAPAGKQFLDWADVPMLSDSLQTSRDIIHEKVRQLSTALNGDNELVG